MCRTVLIISKCIGGLIFTVPRKWYNKHPSISTLAIPDPPQNVRYVDWDVDRMDLEWDTPLRDGGARITHYIVEMRLGKPGASWAEVGQSDGPKRFFSKTGLTKGEKYQFRVRAVNKAGPSEPSEPSEVKVCKARRRKAIVSSQNDYSFILMAISPDGGIY